MSMFNHPDSTFQVAVDSHRQRIARAERSRQFQTQPPRRRPLRQLVTRIRNRNPRPATSIGEATAPAEHIRRRFEAVLLTDIVGSTQQSLAFGDAKWHVVLNRHDEIVRDLVECHGGRSIKHTGDGVLATFSTPTGAVTCGVAVLDALGRIGVQARAGAHVGEVEVRCDGDITGVTVNVTAKVEAYADAGEFWVSATLRDSMLGSDTKFVDRGYHDLTGVDQLWQLYSVPSPVTRTYDAGAGVGADVGAEPSDVTWSGPDRGFDGRSGLDHSEVRRDATRTS
jgi:class 3 adenylate cyclase